MKNLAFALYSQPRYYFFKEIKTIKKNFMEKITNIFIENAISMSQRTNLSYDEYHKTKSDLLRCQTMFPPNISKQQTINSALAALEHNKPVVINWYQKPFWMYVLNILSATIGGILTLVVSSLMK